MHLDELEGYRDHKPHNEADYNEECRGKKIQHKFLEGVNNNRVT